MKTADERIDAALDSVLKASGLALKHNTKEKTLADMREAMRKVMADSYIKGSNDNFEVMMKNVELTGAAQLYRAASSGMIGYATTKKGI